MDNALQPVKFEAFPKIPRWHRDIVVTEKLNGTNAGIYIADDFTTMLAASRSRWIYPGDDNHGFAAWATHNRDELLKLGPGMHWGEWWGRGIQSGYGLQEKRFSLFNTHRWSDAAVRPACCGVVPVLYEGPNDEAAIFNTLAMLANNGSFAAPGFMRPEGIVIFHKASGQLFKKTLDHDAEPKSKAAR